MPGAVIYPRLIPHSAAGASVSTMVTSLDIFATALSVAGVQLPEGYVIDGKDMIPVIQGAMASNQSPASQHEVFLHYCGFNILAARVNGRFKVSVIEYFPI